MNRLRFSSWLIIGMMVSNLFLYPADLGLAQVGKGVDVTVIQPVNINKATIEELQSIRGIGPALAERIVNHRDANGKFQSYDDLVEVRGIGEAKLERIKNQIAL